MNELVRVKIADYAVLKGQGVIITVGLGSCVGIVLYDKRNKVGGLAHILLADSNNFNSRGNGFNPFKFADTAVPMLIEEMEKYGGTKGRMEAKVAGGSQLFNYNKTGEGIGAKNIQKVCEVLNEKGIHISGKDVGGNYGRTMQLFVDSGKVLISTVGKEEKEI